MKLAAKEFPTIVRARCAILLGIVALLIAISYSAAPAAADGIVAIHVDAIHRVATYYQGEPEPLDFNRRCGTWGVYNPYIVDDSFNVRAKGAAYYALQLLTQQWALPGDRPHGVHPVTTSLGENKRLLTAYALKRPDGIWSVLIVNKDGIARPVTVDFNRGGAPANFTGAVDVVTFGREQYGWAGHGPADLPSPDSGLKRSTRMDGAGTYVVAPESLTVIRGAIEIAP
ncbi:MAG TPA: hypothetical protein VII69_08490 [Candidatus Eremiobacteraceae bacterium]